MRELGRETSMFRWLCSVREVEIKRQWSVGELRVPSNFWLWELVIGSR